MLHAMTRRRALWASGIAAAALFLALVVVDRQIQESGGPGIIPFELTRSTERATEILAHWGQDGRDAARVSIAIDFPYLVAYGAFFSLAVLALRDAARRRGWDGYARPATAIALLPIVAAACDAVENLGMWAMIEGEGVGRLPPVVTAFALAKFVTLGIAQIYLLGGLAAMARQRLRETTNDPV